MKRDFTDATLRAKAVLARHESHELRRKLNIPSEHKAIRHKCLDCMGGSTREIRLCRLSDCPLWPYRFGRCPKKEDLRVPLFDRNGNLTGYRDYEECESDSHGKEEVLQ